MSISHTLNTKGLACPEPLMRLRNKIREINSGERLHIVATDPTTKRDFENFCHHMKHELEFFDEQKGVLTFVIRKS